jgi:hypothetical protein
VLTFLRHIASDANTSSVVAHGGSELSDEGNRLYHEESLKLHNLGAPLTPKLAPSCRDLRQNVTLGQERFFSTKQHMVGQGRGQCLLPYFKRRNL